LLDFALHVFDLCPYEVSNLTTTEEAKENYDYFTNSFGINSFPKSDKYSLLLWDDQGHNFDEVIDICQRALGCSESEARRLTYEVDGLGRSITLTSANLDHLSSIAKQFINIKLDVTIMNVNQLFYENLAGFIITYLKDLVSNTELACLYEGAIQKKLRYVIGSSMLMPWKWFFPYAADDDIKPDWLRRTSPLYPNVNYPAFPPEMVQFPNMSNSSQLSGYFREFSSSHNELFVDTFGPLSMQLELAPKFLDFKIQPNTGPWVGSASHPFEGCLDAEEIEIEKIRLDHLFEQDVLLWKSVKLDLKNLYIGTLLAEGHAFRQEFGVHFSAMYSDLYAIDRKPERSPDLHLSKFSTQILTVPSLALELADKYGIYHTIFSEIENQLSHNISSPEEYYGFNTEKPTVVRTDNSGIKRKIITNFLSDIEHLLLSDNMKLFIPNDHTVLARFISILSKFQGIGAEKRHIRAHVEFEDSSFEEIGDIIYYLSKMISDFAANYSEAPEALTKAIYRVLFALDLWTLNGADTLATNLQNPFNQQLTFPSFHSTLLSTAQGTIGEPIQVPDVLVSSGTPVSLFHPLNELLSALLRHSSILTKDFLQSQGFNNLTHLILGCSDINDDIWWPSARRFLSVANTSVSSLAKSAQIKVNLWVRNGFRVQYEQYFYRHTPFVDCIFRKDLFILQALLSFLPPSYGVCCMLDRFELTKFLDAQFSHRTYDLSQMVKIMLDMLSMLIHCAEDLSLVNDEPFVDQLDREIIHLTIAPTAFSEISKKIGHSYSRSSKFSARLQELCNFTPPTSINASGTFQVKTEYLPFISPYFFKNNYNHVDQAEKAKAERLQDLDPLYFVPKLKPIQNHNFSKLRDFLHNPNLSCILFWCLWHAIHQPEARNLVDPVIYIFLLASVEEDSKFKLDKSDENSIDTSMGLWFSSVYTPYIKAVSNILPASPIEDGYTTLDLFIHLAENQEFKSSQLKIDYLLDIFRKFGGDEARERLKPFYEGRAQSESEEAKRALEQKRKAEAAARRAKIMGQFSQAQKDFLENQKSTFELDEDEDYEDEEFADNAEPWEKPYIVGNCLACQEPGSKEQPYGILAFNQPSKLISTVPLDKVNVDQTISSGGENIKYRDVLNANTKAPSNQFTPSSEYSRFGCHISSCGHIMHIKCLSELTSQPQYVINNTSDMIVPGGSNYKEFLCPLCKKISNTILPVWMNPSFKMKNITKSEDSVENCEFWLDHLFNMLDNFEGSVDDDLPSSLNNQETASPGSSTNNSEDPDSIYTTLNTLNLGHFATLTSVPNRNTQERTGITGFVQNFLSQVIPSSRYSTTEKHIRDYLSHPQGFLAENLPQVPSRVIDGLVMLLESSKTSHWHSTNFKPNLKRYQNYGPSSNPLDCLSHSVAYSISSAESLDRADKNSYDAPDQFLNRIPHTTLECHRVLWNNLITIGSLAGNSYQNDSLRYSIQSLQLLLGIDKNYDDWILLQNPFLILTDMSILAVPMLKIQPLHLIRLLVLLEATRFIVGVHLGFVQDSDILPLAQYSPISSSQSSPQWFTDFCKLISQTGLDYDPLQSSLILKNHGISNLLSLVKIFIVNFLRKAILLMRAMQFHISTEIIPETEDELDFLLLRLKLPVFEELIAETLADDRLKNMVLSWCIPKEDIESPRHLNIVSEYPFTYKLHDLAYKLDDLFDLSNDYICPTCNGVPGNPAICLLCGKILCHRNFCCQKDRLEESRIHMKE
jgi:hypothetical protein